MEFTSSEYTKRINTSTASLAASTGLPCIPTNLNLWITSRPATDAAFSCVYKSDSIFYRIREGKVEIMAIIGRQDIEELLK